MQIHKYKNKPIQIFKYKHTNTKAQIHSSEIGIEGNGDLPPASGPHKALEVPPHLFQKHRFNLIFTFATIMADLLYLRLNKNKICLRSVQEMQAQLNGKRCLLTAKNSEFTCFGHF